jgi:diacylglycerol kinase (ATP)
MAPPDVKRQHFSIRDRLRSFVFAWAGLKYMLRHQHNARVHLGIAVLVCVTGVIAGLDNSDWRWIAIAIGLVWLSETVNTAFEYLCDVVQPEFHSAVEKAKDIAAGAVLISVLTAIAIGCLVFWPRLL